MVRFRGRGVEYTVCIVQKPLRRVPVNHGAGEKKNVCFLQVFVLRI